MESLVRAKWGAAARRVDSCILHVTVCVCTCMFKRWLFYYFSCHFSFLYYLMHLLYYAVQYFCARQKLWWWCCLCVCRPSFVSLVLFAQTLCPLSSSLPAHLFPIIPVSSVCQAINVNSSCFPRLVFSSWTLQPPFSYRSYGSSEKNIKP